jgi:lysozyme inhibitor LprI
VRPPGYFHGPPEGDVNMRALCRHRRAVFTAALMGAVACSEPSRDMIDVVADTMTTPTMRRDLSTDLRVAEQALAQIEDSVDVALGPELAVRLHPMKEAFVTYRKEQCERLKAIFKDGTFGAVAELECLIHLTDSRREFIEEHYDFVERVGAARRASGRANAAHRAIRTP